MFPHLMSAEESSQAKRLKVDIESTTESTEPGSVVLSEALAKFLGSEGREMLQSEALRRVWEYIKVNSLEVGILVHEFALALFPV